MLLGGLSAPGGGGENSPLEEKWVTIEAFALSRAALYNDSWW